MGIFASRTVNTIPIPFDPPNTVTIKKLSGGHIERAQKNFFNGLVGDIQARGGASVQRDIETLFKKEPTDDAKETLNVAVEEVKKDPMNGYDKATLVRYGVSAWTYPESLVPVPVIEKDERGRDVTVMRVPALDDLTDEALDFFAEQVLRLTRPQLFQSKDDQDAEQKNV